MSGNGLTRERIKREAAALFRAKGFNGTSMQELASAVGVSKSSLYHHYSSKQALLSEILELTVDRVTPALEEVAASDLPAAVRLHRAVVLHIVEAIRDQDNVACFVEEGRNLAPRQMAAFVAKRDHYEHFFRRILQDGAAAGEFSCPDVRLGALAILGMANSVVRWYHRDGDYSPDEVASEFARLALRGVLVSTPGGNSL